MNMRNENLTDKLCKIQYYNGDDTIAIIISNNEKQITYIQFNIFGEYDGIILEETEEVENIIYDDECIKFMKKIIDKKSLPNFVFLKKEDFIVYAIHNNRVLGIKTNKQKDNDTNDIKIIGYDDIYVEYQIYERWAQLYKRVRRVKISDIIFMQIDSKYTKLIEKTREE